MLWWCRYTQVSAGVRFLVENKATVMGKTAGVLDTIL